MRKRSIVILTDAAADPRDGPNPVSSVHVVPRLVRLGRRLTLVGGDSSPGQITSQMKKRFLQLMPARLDDFLSTFQQLAAQGFSIVSIHLPSAIDDAYSMAHTAGKMVSRNGDVRIVQAQTTSPGVRFLVNEAAKFASKVAQDTKQVITFIEQLQAESHSILLASKLNQLRLASYPGAFENLIRWLRGEDWPLWFDKPGEALPVLGRDLKNMPLKTGHVFDLYVEHDLNRKRGKRLEAFVAAIPSGGEINYTPIHARPIGLIAPYASLAMVPTNDRVKKIAKNVIYHSQQS